MKRRALSAPALSLLALLALAACGDPRTPEAKLEAAGDALADAHEDAANARDSLSAAKERLEAAEVQLYDSRKAVRSAEKRVLSAEERLERRATDVALFRRIQVRLLEADELAQDAISARVVDGRVTLEGTVANDTAREIALRIARATPGVADVRDQLDVESEDAS